MDPDHAAWMGQMAMTRGDFPNAMNFLSIALEHDFAAPQLCIPLLVQRAECFWQLGKFQASVNDMEEAIRRGLPSKGNHSQVTITITITIIITITIRITIKIIERF